MTAIDAVDDKLRYLSSPESHPGLSGPVELIETSLSWLILVGPRVLKLKKPVVTAWQDLRSLQGRERNAREELRLNRRLAADVYLGLRVLTLELGEFHLRQEDEVPGHASVVDWLVLMRRLPQDQMLDWLIAEGAATVGHVDEVMDVLVPFYKRAARAWIGAGDVIKRSEDALALNAQVLLKNRLLPVDPRPALIAHEAAFLQVQPLLLERVQGGHLVDAHGDMRPQHVCLSHPPVIIDALEFSALLRQLDPPDELIRLGVECEVSGAAWVTPRLLSRYQLAFEDAPAMALLSFYKAQHAMLRARQCAQHLLVSPCKLADKWLYQTVRYIQIAQASHHGMGADAQL